MQLTTKTVAHSGEEKIFSLTPNDGTTVLAALSN